MIFNIDTIFKGIEIGMKVVKAYNDSRATSNQEIESSNISNSQQNSNLYQGTSYHSNELTQSEKNKINRAEVVGKSRSEGRQKMIENTIEKYSLQLFNPLRYTKIYTNLDGQLRSGNGNRILQELENRIRLWHYIDAKVPICIIFYNEKKKADTTYYFTTCITPESISFRAVTERNNRELDTESTECYMVRWDNIEDITYLSVIKRTNTFAIKNDPTFSLFPSNEGYSFQCEGGSLEVPSVYFANHGSVKRALVDIKDISYNSTCQNTYYHEDQVNKDVQQYQEAEKPANFSNHQEEDLDFIDIS